MKPKDYEIRKGRTDPPSGTPREIQEWGRQWSATHRADGTPRTYRKVAADAPTGRS